MRKETISGGQATSLVILYLLGTTVTTGVASRAKNNTWIAILLGILEALPFVLIYIKLLTQLPWKESV